MSTARQRLNTKRDKKRRRRKRLILWVLTPFLIVLLAAGVYGAFLYNKVHSVMGESYQPVERDNSPKEEKIIKPDLKNMSILFIGIDDSAKRKFEDSSRSDALMLATFNDKTNSIKLVSIPRDSYVHIPEVGYNDKITHAHAYGGPAATIEAVEELFDIPIDFYVRMNFNAFIDVVDALGGIEVDVPYDLSEMDSMDRKGAIQLEEGLQELDGEEALALARTRKKDSDIERGKRQQQILESIIEKATSITSVTKYANVIEAIGDNMTTDLSFNQMKSFVSYAAGTSLNIETITLEGQDTYIRGVYYYQLDENNLDETKQTLKSHLGTTITTSDDTGQRNM